MADKYVDPSGNDGNPGTSGSPYLTVKKGVENIGSGDTLFCYAGSYPAHTNISTWASMPSGGGTWATATTVEALNGAVVTFTASGGGHHFRLPAGADAGSAKSYIIIDGIIFDASGNNSHLVRAATSTLGSAWTDHHIRFNNCELKNAAGSGYLGIWGENGETHGYYEFIGCLVHDNGVSDKEHGFYVASSNNLIKGCTIYDNGAQGIQIRSTTHAPSNNQVLGNLVKSNGVGPGISLGFTYIRSNGIIVGQGNGNLIANNVVVETTAGRTTDGGIRVWSAATNTSVLHNTVYNIGDPQSNGCAGIRLQDGTGGILRNNVAYNCTTNLNNTATGSWTISNNSTDGTDPKFIDAANSNFRLQATSPLINAGIAAGINEDFDGTFRPQGSLPDIGAFEYVSAQVGLWSAGNQLPSGAWLNSSFSGSSVRFLMRKEAWDTSVSAAFKLVFKGRTDATYTITKVSIAEKDTTTWDVVDGTNQQVTFGDTWANGGTVPVDGELTSDTIVYALDEAKDYYVTYYASGSVGQFRDGVPDGQGDNAVFVDGDVAGDLDWSAKSFNPTEPWDHVYSVTRIEETTVPQQPDSAPSIGTLGTYVVTPGVESALNLNITDVNSNVVLVTLTSDNSKATLTCDAPTGDAILDVVS